MPHKFPMPPKRQQPSPQASASAHETPDDYTAVADAMIAASEALRVAAADWRTAEEAHDAYAVALARIAGQGAALAAADALGRLSDLSAPPQSISRAARRARQPRG